MNDLYRDISMSNDNDNDNDDDPDDESHDDNNDGTQPPYSTSSRRMRYTSIQRCVLRYNIA